MVDTTQCPNCKNWIGIRENVIEYKKEGATIQHKKGTCGCVFEIDERGDVIEK